MRKRLARGLIGGLLIAASASSAAAQTPPDPQAPPDPQVPPAAARPLRRLEVTVGGGLLGGAGLGSATAEIRSALTSGGFDLFETDTRQAGTPLVDVGLGTMVTSRIGVEGRVRVGWPDLRTSVRRDAEDAPSLTVVGGLTQVVVEGSGVILFAERRLGGVAVVPFLTGGAGYLRQVHGSGSVDGGRLYHGGGGIRHWFDMRPRALVRAAGLRADARLYVVTGGYTVDRGARPQVAISGGFFMVF